MMRAMEEMLANAEAGSRHLYWIIESAMLLGGLVAILILVLHHRRTPPDTETLTARLVARAFSFTEIYGIVLLHLTLMILAMFSGRLFYAEQIPTAKLVVALLIYTIVTFAIFITIWKRGGTLDDTFGLRLRQLKLAALSPLFYLAIVPLLLLSSALLTLLGYELPLQESVQQFVDSPQLEQILFSVMAIIAAPFFEELLFRGIIFPALLKRMGLAGSTLLVSSLFALLHFHFFIFLILFGSASLFCLLFWPAQNRWAVFATRGVLALVVLFSAYITFISGSFHSFTALMILSSAACLAYWRTGSLWACIGLHAIFNTVSILALNLFG
ncbi:CPBP family intramembrane glutamic endopeptidase [Pontiella sulfatireligans]|uniref:CAAX prenyl protease 2/Lysostaphin resistance protein A-like domain-containing protein n=1 Tax=Pontiella sulfatireligans TaxID=2750658 RepID=A0A6C2UNN6_9BACT|nr:CPBP family intramembrane glutamic endopeptidase [Pontiella sulfatireligans]VGO21798.1 hypothetical protein SCARR_03875 [Pontiella sulfatireligans]